MADSLGGDFRQSARDRVSRAANLLNRAVELLNNDGSCAVSDRAGARSADSSVSSASSCGSQPGSAVQSSSSSEQWRTRAIANFQRIFGGLQPRSQDQRAGGRTGSRNTGKSAKRTLNPTTGQWFWKRETWTHKFYCFHKTDQICPENRDEREVSRRAGLAEKKITFRKNADSAEVLTELEEAYPRLKDGGGFELLRSGQRVKDLVLIPSPPGGYSVNFLKNCGLGQSTIYIRPIQKDLDTTPISNSPSVDGTSEPSVKCLNCEDEVPMSLLRDHHNKCVGGPSSSKCSGVDIRKYGVVASESCSEESDTDVTPVLQQSINDAEISVLQDVFPTMPPEKLQFALREYQTVDAAAAFLLRDTGLEGQSDSEGEVDSASLNSTAKRLKVPCEPEEALKKWRESKVDILAQRKLISVDRTSPRLFKSLFAKYKRAEMNLSARLEVEFDGEPGVDAGSLTREYFNMLMGLLRSGETSSMPPLFEGQEGHIIPVHSVDALSSGCFYIAGQMIAHSVLHGGVGMVGMSKAVSKYIVSEGSDAEQASAFLTVADIPDLDTRNVLLKANKLQQLKILEKQ